MNTFLNYAIEANLGLILFFAMYKVLLRGETQFAYRRYYLLSGLLLSALFPLVSLPAKINGIPTLSESLPATWLPEVAASVQPERSLPSAWEVISWVYLAGVLVFTVKFLAGLFHVFRKAIPVPAGKRIIEIDHPLLMAFSFFNFIFISRAFVLSPADRERIIRHEQVHGRKLHSLDILLIEILRVIFWFNPLLIGYKKEMSMVHEFEADAEVSLEENPEQYCHLLARSAIESSGLALANHFNNSLTLKRIAMIKAMKTNVKKWKTAIVFLTACTVFVTVACQDQVMDQIQEVATTTSISGDFPAELMPEVKRIEQQYPGIKLFYVEAESMNADKIKQIAPGNILYTMHHKYHDKQGNQTSERVGLIVKSDDYITQLAEQTKTEATETGESIFLVVEESASPVDGMAAFYEAVVKNISVPESVIKRGVMGRVFIELVIEPDGTTSNHKLIKGVDSEFDEVALNAVKNANLRWNPGRQKGMPVRQKFVIPIALQY
jgi:TonB family protein